MKEEIRKFFKGEVLNDETTLKAYSRDASLFEVKPKLVVFPRDSEDLKNLVKWVRENPGYSVTIRAAGSDMTGGPLSESIVADVTKHINRIGVIEGNAITTEPGIFYRDFEKKTLEKNLILPCFTASKNLCALGGMFGNNCAGERSLRYGKMENFVLKTKVILSDSHEYTVKPLSKTELETKMNQGDFEAEIYKKIHKLIEENKEVIEKAKPKVSKNSAGYYLWNVYPKPVEGSEQIFDLNKLLVGSQGTLGIVTEMKLRLVPEKKYHDMVVVFFKSWDELPQVVNAILPYDPESLETFDEDTLKLGIHFMPEIARRAGSNFFSFALKFIPEVFIGARMLGLPKLIVLVEIAENTEEAVKGKVQSIVETIKSFHVWSRVIEKDTEEEKFWVMRRESFNLLREHVKEKRTAPFIDDFCIPTDKVPEFLPRALKILEEASIDTNIAGHAGNGNFHIIPLMDLKKESERAKIPIIADKFYDLVAEYKGTITAEHNDGIIRTPYLGKMYSPEVLELFKKTKEIFDPKNIFNPGKKVPSTAPRHGGASSGQVSGTLEYLESHIAIE
ncbi:MAG: FAD-binding oxidoreductase [bacterium]|nr:FAD-binding oxidoreductase [bacterium]MDZ4206029.1 FAD-binding oxidoreductase [Patescibacteria group bacterium]